MTITLRHLKKQSKNLAQLLAVQPPFSVHKPDLISCQAMVASLYGFPSWDVAIQKIGGLEKKAQTTLADSESTLPFVPNKGLPTPSDRLARDAQPFFAMDTGIAGNSAFMDLIHIDHEQARPLYLDIMPLKKIEVKKVTSKKSPLVQSDTFYQFIFRGLCLDIPRTAFEEAIQALMVWRACKNSNSQDFALINAELKKLCPLTVPKFTIGDAYLANFLLQARRLILGEVEPWTGPRSVIVLFDKWVSVRMVRGPDYYVLKFFGAELRYRPEDFIQAVKDMQSLQEIKPPRKGVRRLGQQARHLVELLSLPVKKTGSKISLMACQQMVAKLHGFSDWHAAVDKITREPTVSKGLGVLNVSTNTIVAAFTFVDASLFPPLDPSEMEVIAEFEKSPNRDVRLGLPYQVRAQHRIQAHAVGFFKLDLFHLAEFVKETRRLLDTDTSLDHMAAKSVSISTAAFRPIRVTKFRGNLISSLWPGGFYTMNFLEIYFCFSFKDFGFFVSELESFSKAAATMGQEVGNVALSDQLNAVVAKALFQRGIPSFTYANERHYATKKAFDLLEDSGKKWKGSRSVVFLFDPYFPVELIRVAATPTQTELYILDFCSAQLHYRAEDLRAALKDLGPIMKTLKKLRASSNFVDLERENLLE